MKDEENIILIAKMYTGEYIENNIGHEIINFFKPDNEKEYYYGYIIYNGKIDPKKCHKIKSILFVSDVKDRKIKVIAKVENPEIISDKIGNYQEQVDYIYKNNIRYGGVLLNEIMQENGIDEYGIYITYKAKKIMKPKEDIYILLKDSKEIDSKVNIKTSWNIGHNIGYIANNDKKNEKNYAKISNLLEADIWEKIKEKKIDENIKKEYSNLYDEQESFIDIVNREYDETVFSNMLFYYFNKKKMLKDFAKELLKVDLSDNVKIKKEKAIKSTSKEGRIDLWVEDEENKICIIIENKIKSSINGKYITNDKHTNKEIRNSQLDKYREWIDTFKEEKKCDFKYKDYIKKYCIFVPNYKINELQKDIVENNLMPKDENGKDLYEIITYKKIFDYFNSETAKEKMKGDIHYIGFLKALSKHIYTFDIEMERKFVSAINKAEKAGKIDC